jgi:xylan 1,4-beta-xylosidase
LPQSILPGAFLSIQPRALARFILPAFCLALLAAPSARAQSSPPATDVIVVDAQAPTTPFPHFWEIMFGSERAIVTLREDYRRDLREVKRITGFSYVRFHAIFHDEMGIYDEDAQGAPVYNFTYVDRVYDGLLANGVRPFIELSFMPSKLAAKDIRQPFFYHPNVSPPKDWKRWEDLVYRFTQHLVERYGVDEVAKWYFEVWNEPNIDFWAGEPKESTYYELYDRAAAGIKRVSPRLRVGGPATAQAAWADRFIKHCVEKNSPVDFVSTHVYGNDSAKDVFGTNDEIPRTKMVCRAVQKVHEQIRSSARPDLPLIWSEYNASYMNEPDVTDAAFMGPWIADTIRQCDGLTDTMSYWSFSDVFEEQGPPKLPFYGGFGLLAPGGIPKPAFHAFELLHKLGTQRIPVVSESALATRRPDGSLVIAVWNLALPEESGAPKTLTLQIKGLAGTHRVKIYLVGRDHGSPLPAWTAMGKPPYPTSKQVEMLRKAAALPVPETRPLVNGKVTLTLPPHSLFLLELN